MTISELAVKIIADTTGLDLGLKNASKAISDVGDKSKEANGKTEGLVNQFNSLKRALVKAGLVAAVGAVAKAIYDSVQAFGEAELAAKRLDAISTMQGLSDGTERITALANELQNLIGVDGDLVVQLGAELIAQGKSVDQTEEMIRAASELSAMTGQDLSTSVRQLTTTYSGMAGQLGKTIPELKDLTEEQLKAGGAVDVIMEKYGGMAAQLSDSVIPATNRLKEAVGDMKEAFGEDFAETFKDGANLLTDIINAMLNVRKALKEVTEESIAYKESMTGFEDVEGRAILAAREHAKATTEANRAAISYQTGVKNLKKELDALTTSTDKLTDAELENARSFLFAQMKKSSSMDQLTQAQKKLDVFDAEIKAREKVRRDKSLVDQKARDAEALKDAQQNAADIASAQQTKEAETVAAMIAAEDKISQAKADAYGDSIVNAVKEADARIAEAKEAADRQKQIGTAMYDALESAAQSLTSIVMKGYQDQADAAAKLAEQEKTARAEKLTAELAEMDADTQAKLSKIDAETQAYMIANGLMEQTAKQKLQAELDAAILAGDTVAAAKLKIELDRTAYLEEQEKERSDYIEAQAEKKADIEAAAKKEDLRIAKETEKAKAQAKYDADLFSWQSSLLLGIAQAAQAVIAQLTVPVAGPWLAAAAGITGLAQVAIINANKPVAPALARGSDFTQGGATLVGEEGPEMVNMPRGASVTPNSRGGTGGGPVFNIYSPVAVTPSVAAQEYTRMVRNLAFEGVL